jgi:ABC-type multidrug transport system ATPase subunit
MSVVYLCVLQGNGELQLLHNISGTFRPGVLTALMGVSGE